MPRLGILNLFIDPLHLHTTLFFCNINFRQMHPRPPIILVVNTLLVEVTYHHFHLTNNNYTVTKGGRYLYPTGGG